MRQGTDPDLFPWIFGIVLAAAGAFGVMVATTPSTLPNSPATASASPPPVVVPVSVPPLPVTVPSAPDTARNAPDAAPEAPVAAPAQAASPPTGAVWQCVVRGQRVFADSPCGADATLHQLAEVNRMDAGPARTAAYAGGYGPDYGGYAADYTDVPADQRADKPDGEAATTVYIGRRAALIGVRPRPVFEPHPHPNPHPHPQPQPHSQHY